MKSKMAAAFILNFLHLEFWSRDPIQRDILYLHTKFEPNLSFLGKVVSISAKSKMTAVRHFGIVMTSFNTIHVEYLVIS